MLISLFIFFPENPEVAVFIYMTNKSRSSLTIVDFSGIDHDDRHRWSTGVEALQSNEDWIKTSWKRMHTPNEHRKQYRREYDALPKSYDRLGGTGKSIVAGINYWGTTTVDLYALQIGTLAFGIQNLIGYTAQFIKPFHKHLSLKNIKYF